MNATTDLYCPPPKNLIARAVRVYAVAVSYLDRIPDAMIALLARISIATTFWLSGQTKIEGLVLDPVGLQAQWGIPHVSDGALALFRSDYALPLLPPALAASMAAVAEHVFPFLLLLGLASRLSALALLAMTLVIEIFVYPDAWPTHGIWAACLLLIIARGPGTLSIDHLIARNRR